LPPARNLLLPLLSQRRLQLPRLANNLHNRADGPRTRGDAVGGACGGAGKVAEMAHRGEADMEYPGEPQLAIREGGGDGDVG